MKTSKEAHVVLARCSRSRENFGIRIERRSDGVWSQTWAFPISAKNAAREGYGSAMLSGRVVTEASYPGCPYCGGAGWVLCGRCGKLTCASGSIEWFTCAWCGNSGAVSGAETFALQGGGF